MKLIKKILNALYNLYLFKPYTFYPRWIEIGYGIMAWFNLFIILYVIFN